MSTPRISVREATGEDAGLVLAFIRELAEYERMADEVTAAVGDIAEAITSEQVGVLLAYVDKEPAGFALYFANFSTFVGKSGLYLEDLYVRPAHRGLGLGRLLLAELARHAVASGAARIDWAVLDWNRPAIAFYEKLGAGHQDTWLPFRLTGEPLHRLARTSFPADMASSDMAMTDDTLNELLKKLQDEIGSGESLTDAQREALSGLHAAIEGVLAREGAVEPPVEGVRAYIEELEDSHPTLTMTLGRIMDALNKMGI